MADASGVGVVESGDSDRPASAKSPVSGPAGWPEKGGASARAAAIGMPGIMRQTATNEKAEKLFLKGRNHTFLKTISGLRRVAP